MTTNRIKVRLPTIRGYVEIVCKYNPVARTAQCNSLPYRHEAIDRVLDAAQPFATAQIMEFDLTDEIDVTP
jgi:hypothetical protein